MAAGPWRMLARGLRKRCAVCGGGDLYAGWLTMRDACPTCGYRFERRGSDAFFLGAMLINFAATEGVLGIMLLIGVVMTLPDPPVLLLCSIAVPLMVAAPIAFYPFAKTIWAAFDLMIKPAQLEDYATRASR